CRSFPDRTQYLFERFLQIAGVQDIGKRHPLYFVVLSCFSLSYLWLNESHLSSLLQSSVVLNHLNGVSASTCPNQHDRASLQMSLKESIKTNHQSLDVQMAYLVGM